MPLSVIFFYGFLGAFAVDFQAFFEEVSQLGPRVVGLPNRYTHKSFWMLRLIHALMGGSLAIVWAQTYLIVNPLVLVAVGGSTRVIILKFGQIVAGLKKIE
jgi:hypothetical protein